MKWLRRLFGRGTDKYDTPVLASAYALASPYWRDRLNVGRQDAYVLYTFDTEEAARAALLDVPCIHTVSRSHELICTRVLAFGYYPNDDGEYEAIVGGSYLTRKLWEKAKASFAAHGGRPKSELEPGATKAPPSAEKGETGGAAASGKAVGSDADVVFVREDRREQTGRTMIYRVHRAPSAAVAKAFLQKNPVTRQFYYLVVETPEGNYFRHIQGMYKE